MHFVDPGTESRWAGIKRATAALALILIGMRTALPQGLTVGVVFALALLPVWLPTLRRYRGLVAIAVVALLCIGSGIVLTQLAKGDHDTRNNLLISHTTLMLELVCGVGVVAWSREILSLGTVAAWFGFGTLLGVSPTSAQYLSNPWRFGYSVAITITVLGIAYAVSSRILEVAAAAVLTLLSAVSDARSSFAILLLTVILVAFQMRPTKSTRSRSAARTIVVVAALAIVVYNVGQALILDGYLGQKTQQRTLAQLDESGSIILGGRPELAATLALMRDQPTGFGSGTLPSHHDLLIAKTGMAAINYNPDNGYVERYMFGNGFELHSMFGDLWSNFGIIGLVLVLLVLFLTVRGFADGLARRKASGIVIYLTAKTVWNLAFSPFFGSVPTLTLLLGIIVLPKVAKEAKRAKTRKTKRSKPTLALTGSSRLS